MSYNCGLRWPCPADLPPFADAVKQLLPTVNNFAYLNIYWWRKRLVALFPAIRAMILNGMSNVKEVRRGRDSERGGRKSECRMLSVSRNFTDFYSLLISCEIKEPELRPTQKVQSSSWRVNESSNRYSNEYSYSYSYSWMCQVNATATLQAENWSSKARKVLFRSVPFRTVQCAACNILVKYDEGHLSSLPRLVCWQLSNVYTTCINEWHTHTHSHTH